ncbi:hypothetical protein TWF694_008013 [Orbilia ellipsospora]|uniref:BTB domain-containing protein n=1 Tax=Orbilia ellipsospora TaxID=2528407 RepID=A0AAV9XLG9_9PEZI
MSNQINDKAQVPAGADTTAPTKEGKDGNGKENQPAPSAGSSLPPKPPQTIAPMAAQNIGKSTSDSEPKSLNGSGNQNRNSQLQRSQQSHGNYNNHHHQHHHQGRNNNYRGKGYKGRNQQRYNHGPLYNQNSNLNAANDQQSDPHPLPNSLGSHFRAGDVRLEENPNLEHRRWNANNSGNENNGHSSRFSQVQDIRLLENPNLERHVYMSKGGKLLNPPIDEAKQGEVFNITEVATETKETEASGEQKETSTSESNDEKEEAPEKLVDGQDGKPKFIPPHLRSRGFAPTTELKTEPKTETKIESDTKPKEPEHSFEIDLDREYESNVGLFCGEPGVGVLFMVDREPLKRESTWFKERIGDEEISFMMSEDPTVVQLMLQYIHVGNFDEHAAKVPNTAAELKEHDEKSSLESLKTAALAVAENIFVEGVSAVGRMFAHEDIAGRLMDVIKMARKYDIQGLGKLASVKLKSLTELMSTYMKEIEKCFFQLKKERNRCNQVKRIADHYTMMIDNYYGRESIKTEDLSQTVDKINGIFPTVEKEVDKEIAVESVTQSTQTDEEKENKHHDSSPAAKESNEISDTACPRSTEPEQTEDHLIKITVQAPAKDAVMTVEEPEKQNEAAPEKDKPVTTATATGAPQEKIPSEGNSKMSGQEEGNEGPNIKTISQNYVEKIVCESIKEDNKQIAASGTETEKNLTVVAGSGQGARRAAESIEMTEQDENGIELKDTEERGQPEVGMGEKICTTESKGAERGDTNGEADVTAEPDQREEVAGDDKGGIGVEEIDMKDVGQQSVSEQ